MSVAVAEGAGDVRLARYSVFAAMLAMAGLPIYIHAPKFYVDNYAVGLGVLGGVLAILRLIDVVQDPVLGWLAGRVRRWRAVSVALAATLMAVSMVGLFAVPPMLPPAWWFALTLTGLFSGFSYLTIVFYAQGVDTGTRIGARGHVRLATWRETGALIGVCVAAVAPAVLEAVGIAPFTGFAAGFAALAVVAVVAMAPEWRGAGTPPVPNSSVKRPVSGDPGLRPAPADSGLRPVLGDSGLRPVLGDPLARRLLLIALLNATPVAVTSTLFLFFVESRLDAPGWEGPFLLLFFLSAAASAPAWGWIAARRGAKPTLLAAMVLAIVAFGFAATLGAGDTVAFAVICIASGAALGADLTLLPAIFATRMSRIAPEAEQAFGLWSFVSKITLSLAAIILLPVLQASGFVAGTNNPPGALTTLSLLYAVLPCGLKFLAIVLLAFTPIEKD